MFQLKYYLSELDRRLWLRPAAFSLVALLTPVLAILFQGSISFPQTLEIGAQAVEDILSILATSLLAVTTFSLGTMVSAYAAASRDVTPRATRLLLADTTSQNVLATFIGVFLYSLVSIILLKTGIYTAEGRTIVFVVTLLIVLITVFTLIRWVDFLARFGRVGNTIDRVETSARNALAAWRDSPAFGGTPRAPNAPVPAGYEPLCVDEIGYVQTVNMEALATVAEETGKTVHLEALPGKFVNPGNPVAHIDHSLDEDVRARIRNAFVVYRERNYEQDPRFGVLVLSEIASRALSPGINDTGTAIEVIGRGVRVLSALPAIKNGNDTAGTEASKPPYPGVSVPRLKISDLFDDLFGPIARDGAGLFEVQARLQKALIALCEIDQASFGGDAIRLSRRALEQAENVLVLEQDKAALRDLAAEVERHAGTAQPERGVATSP